MTPSSGSTASASDAEPVESSAVESSPPEDEPVEPLSSEGNSVEPIASPEPVDSTLSRWYRLPSLSGAWVALVLACLSMTPSLLPRPGLVQGTVAGITGAIGYGLGLIGAWLWREFAGRRQVRRGRRRSWQIFFVAGGALLVVFFVLGQYWQRQSRTLIGIGSESLGSIALMPVAGLLVFALLMAIARGLRWLFRRLADSLTRWMGARAARATGWLAVALSVVLLVSGVLVDGVIAVADRSFALQDTGTSSDAREPTTALRSGGPGSLIPWDTLGFQGRNFVGRGPTEQQISDFNDSPALAPIRAYAGIESAPEDVESRAKLAVDDLVRAGGFDRKYVLVAGTTGTGWVDPGALSSVEYETGGDIASIAIQYSYLPSWASIAVDQQRAREAGRALFDAVYERWSQLPEGSRPKLLLFGESLGSFALDAAFSGEADLRNRISGAIFAGPPWFNPLHKEFTDQRDAGSPEIQPVFRDGRVVRFASDPATGIPPVSQPWGTTRVLYLQHASDPVTWLSTDLIWSRPDWLSEPRGADVNPNMTWLPVITFWQVTMDMLEPVDVPPGHGHRYTQEYVAGWAAVIQPPGWTPAKTDRLRAIVMGFEDKG
ncbi:putative membrane protein [Antricoccus suffuscus]|uniref:Putative membrane protein n=1 Tax=Antricoccus suffuscus TaxID=1629062 RepID=A0A2T1A1U9_9ACTN|nr:alpha/beta-hydrolase family protein [Antricoccus suffuscus]PRZ42308.1 putative membrane protein [Antricoccus suffuscus]